MTLNYVSPLLTDDALLTTNSDWQLRSLLRFVRQVRDGLSETGDEGVIRLLLGNFMQAADAYYKKGCELLLDGGPEQEARRRRLLVSRIGAEWGRLAALVGGVRMIAFDDPHLRALRRVLQDAWNDIQLEPDEPVVLIPHFGRDFELVTFDYMKGLHLLGVPVDSLYCPWDWTMVWHEIAGIYLQSERAQLLLNDLFADAAVHAVWEHWKQEYPPLIQPLFALKDEETVWRDWLAEFVEDAVGVLCLGRAMAKGLRRILAQHYEPEVVIEGNVRRIVAQDKKSRVERDLDPAGEGQAQLYVEDPRHPPAFLRVEVALALAEGLTSSQQQPPASASEALARALYDRRDQIVRRTAAKAQGGASDGRVAVIIAELLDGYLISSGSGHELIDQLLARFGSVSLQIPLPTALVSPMEDRIKAAGSWDELIELNFSLTDYGDAKAVDESKDNHANFRISFSGVLANKIPHSGTATADSVRHA